MRPYNRQQFYDNIFLNYDFSSRVIHNAKTNNIVSVFRERKKKQDNLSYSNWGGRSKLCLILIAA